MADDDLSIERMFARADEEAGGDILQWLDQQVFAADIDTVDRPHVVVCLDREADHFWCDGPFDNLIDASVYAEWRMKQPDNVYAKPMHFITPEQMT